MNNLSIKHLITLVIFVSLSISVCEAQNYKRSIRNPERWLFGKSLDNKKEAKIKESRGVVKAKKKQAANEKRLNKEYDDFVKKSQKRAVEIQTPEVQARMKENRREAENRYREKNRNVAKNTRKAGKKYKK